RYLPRQLCPPSTSAICVHPSGPTDAICLIRSLPMTIRNPPSRADDLMASSSSKGPTGIDHILKPDLVAPGNVMTSLQVGATLEHSYPNNRPLLSSYQTGKTGYSDKYYVLSGTSMAAAVVSGGVADLLEAQPQLTPDQVKARLMKTAYKIF